MFRKYVLCLLIVSHGLLLYPDVIARERSIKFNPSSYIVRGSFVKSGLKDLKWLVNPKEWGIEQISHVPSVQPTLSGEEPFVAPKATQAAPRFAFAGVVLPIADKYGIDWRLVAAVMSAESNFNPHAVSSKGAVGLMQVMPATAALYRIKAEELTIPARNIEAGVRHLKMLNQRFDGDLELVIAAYNSGEGAVDRFGGIPPFKDTRAFVRKVMGRYQRHLRSHPPAVQIAGRVPVSKLHSISRPASGL